MIISDLSDSIEEGPSVKFFTKEYFEKTTAGFRMFDGTTLLGMCRLPAHPHRVIAAETHIYTRSQPPKCFGKGSAGQTEFA